MVEQALVERALRYRRDNLRETTIGYKLIGELCDAITATRTPIGDEVTEENRKLRQIISELGYCTPDASLEFMAQIPGEIAAMRAIAQEQSLARAPEGE